MLTTHMLPRARLGSTLSTHFVTVSLLYDRAPPKSIFNHCSKLNLDFQRNYSVDRQWGLGQSIPFFGLVDPYSFNAVKRVWIDQNKKGYGSTVIDSPHCNMYVCSWAGRHSYSSEASGIYIFHCFIFPAETDKNLNF